MVTPLQLDKMRTNGNGWFADYLENHGRLDFAGTDVESDSRRPVFLSLDGLLERLGFRDDEFVSVCHEPTDGVFTASGAVERGAVAAQVRRVKKKHDNSADVWFGVNPISESVPRGRKGKASDVTRLSALWADLDVGPGKCASLSVAHKAVDQLSEVVGSRPVAITSSGGGLQPYWAIKDGPATPIGIQRVLLRWKVVVKTVVSELQTEDQREAAQSDPRAAAKADSVFNADRVLRVPNTYNCKDDYAEFRKRGKPGVLVRSRPDSGRPLSVEEIEARLDEFGVDDLAGHDTPGAASDNTSTVDEIWEWAEENLPNVGGEPCEKMHGMAKHWQRQIDQDSSSHDKINDALWTLACTATEGHRGLSAATLQVQNHWIEDVKGRNKRTLDELQREIFRSGVEALRKLKGEIDSGRRRLYGSCGCGEYDGSAGDDLEAATDRAYLRRKADEMARQRLAVEAWTAPVDDGDLSHQIAHPEPDEGHLVEGLIRARGVVQINAQYKAGKTTLASVNLPKALVTGEPFLRHFDVEFGPDECVAVWNLEVDRQDLVDWLNEVDIPKEHQSRVFPICLRGNRSVDFRNPLAVEWAVDWLKDRRIAVWIIDPLSKLYRGEENSSTEFNAWWTTLEDIMRRAGVRVTVIVHHSGHGGEGRARGTSAMMGNPDALLEYRHSGDHGELPPDSKRYLKAFGRRVNQPEIRLDWDPATGELYVDEGGGSRADDRKRAMAVKAWSALKTAPADQLPMNQGQLLEAMGRRAKGKNNKDALDAIRYAEQCGWIAIDDGGTGKAKLHSLGPSAPLNDQKFAVTIGDDDGEADE